MDQVKTVNIEREFITLGQLLKEEWIIPTCGAAKWFLQETPVWVNQEQDQRRGRKLYPGDQVRIGDLEEVVIEGQA